MRVRFYESESGRVPAREFIDKLSFADKERIDNCLKGIERYDFDAPGLVVKPIDGKLWEIKVRSADGSYRLFYITLKGKVMVVLHGYKKQSQKAPLKELMTAKQRMKEVFENETSYCNS